MWGTGCLGTEVPQRGAGAEFLVEGSGTNPPPRKLAALLRLSGCQTMHNFVYLAKVQEPLIKHEKNLRCSACLFADLSSN